jgi:hypothetical protein
MGKAEVDTTVRLAHQYLNPNYRPGAEGGIEAQQAQEEGIFSQVIAMLAKKDQDVLKIWRIVQKNKKRG